MRSKTRKQTAISSSYSRTAEAVSTVTTTERCLSDNTVNLDT